LALAESLFIAFVLTAFVDPYLKLTGYREIAEKTSESNFWEFVNPRFPIELRQHFKKLASAELIDDNCVVNVDFDWNDRANDILRVTITTSTRIRNLSTAVYIPRRNLYILSSTSNLESEYVQWVARIDSANVNRVKQGEALRPYLIVDDAGTLYLDESRLVDSFPQPVSVGPGEVLDSKLKGIMYRRSRGFLPISGSRPSLGISVRCGGAAQRDLHIEVSCNDGGAAIRQDNADDDECTWTISGCLVQNYLILLRWRPKRSG
jgi:hypothetical protein